MNIESKLMRDQLREVCLFGSMDDKQLDKLAQISTIKQFQPGNILFYEGDEPTNIYFLLDGLVKLFKYDDNNNINILSYYYSQSLLGEAATLQKEPHQVSAECEIQSTILVLSFSEFEKNFLKNPDVALGIIMHLVSKLQTLMNSNIKQSSMQKLAGLIFENHELFMKLKKYKIAEILNMAPETFSRNLKKLEENNIISYSKNNFIIKDKQALRELCTSCHL